MTLRPIKKEGEAVTKTGPQKGKAGQQGSALHSSRSLASPLRVTHPLSYQEHFYFSLEFIFPKRPVQGAKKVELRGETPGNWGQPPNKI